MNSCSSIFLLLTANLLIVSRLKSISKQLSLFPYFFNAERFILLRLCSGLFLLGCSFLLLWLRFILNKYRGTCLQSGDANFWRRFCILDLCANLGNSKLCIDFVDLGDVLQVFVLFSVKLIFAVFLIDCPLLRDCLNFLALQLSLSLKELIRWLFTLLSHLVLFLEHSIDCITTLPFLEDLGPFVLFLNASFSRYICAILGLHESRR